MSSPPKHRSGNATPNNAATLSRQNTSKSLKKDLRANSAAHHEVFGSEKAISVVCRIRPISQKELREGSQMVTFVDGNGTSVDVGQGDGKLSFDFDASIAPDGSQDDVYNKSAKDIVVSYLDGYNGTVFAYGQTGSGKTYTMEGIVSDPARRGIVPRMIQAIFDHTAKSPDYMEFKIQVQMMEIYNEKIRDLLHPDKDNLRLREERGGGIYVEGCTSQLVKNEREVQDLMEMGAATRATAETIMNEASSRSHSVFIITLEQTNKTDGVYKKSKLFMVDLAGSEMVRKTGAKGTTLLEAQHINKSLSQLNKVILSLSEGKASHIPYRDSKLTRLLQEAIGGNCRTALIICCSPALNAQAETMSTMRFGKSAKRIKNRARMNKEQNPAELKLMLEQMRAKNGELMAIINAKDFEIETLKKVAESGGGGGGAGGKKGGGGGGADRESALKMVELKEEMVREMEKRERVEEEMAALEQMIAEAEQEHEDELDDLRSEVDRLQYALAQKDQELFYTKTSMINGIMRQSLQGTPAARPDDGAVDRVMAEMSKLEAQAVAAAGDSGKDKKGGKANKDVLSLLENIKAMSKMMKTQLKSVGGGGGASTVEMHGAITAKLAQDHHAANCKCEQCARIPYSHGTKPQPRSISDEDSKLSDERSNRGLSSAAPKSKKKVGVQGKGFGGSDKNLLELAAEKAAQDMKKDGGPRRKEEERPGTAESL